LVDSRGVGYPAVGFMFLVDNFTSGEINADDSEYLDLLPDGRLA